MLLKVNGSPAFGMVKAFHLAFILAMVKIMVVRSGVDIEKWHVLGVCNTIARQVTTFLCMRQRNIILFALNQLVLREVRDPNETDCVEGSRLKQLERMNFFGQKLVVGCKSCFCVLKGCVENEEGNSSHLLWISPLPSFPPINYGIQNSKSTTQLFSRKLVISNTSPF